MRISDWSSDVCSSDLHGGHDLLERDAGHAFPDIGHQVARVVGDVQKVDPRAETLAEIDGGNHRGIATGSPVGDGEYGGPFHGWLLRSGEEKRCSAKPPRRMIVRDRQSTRLNSRP